MNHKCDITVSLCITEAEDIFTKKSQHNVMYKPNAIITQHSSTAKHYPTASSHTYLISW